jgi:hypothetical protein
MHLVYCTKKERALNVTGMKLEHGTLELQLLAGTKRNAQF